VSVGLKNKHTHADENPRNANMTTSGKDSLVHAVFLTFHVSVKVNFSLKVDRWNLLNVLDSL